MSPRSRTDSPANTVATHCLLVSRPAAITYMFYQVVFKLVLLGYYQRFSCTIGTVKCTMYVIACRWKHRVLVGSDTETSVLATCNPKKFKQSKLEFVNHLRPLKGCSGVSLAYVICDDTLDPATAVDDDERV
jgi:hypothetical protein